MKNFISLIAVILFSLLTGCNNNQKKESNMETKAKGEIIYSNPEGLHKNPAYSQMVITKGSLKTIYIGGQNAVDKDGQIIGKGDIKAQAVQILNNLKIALADGGASLSNVIKWNVYILESQDSRAALQAFQEDMKTMSHPPIITGIFVSSLAQPDFLLEMDAVAVVPE